MTTLRVILDEVLSPVPTGTARYAEELTRALIETAPPGCVVGGIVASSPESDYALLRERLPGLSDLVKSALARRELTAAWQHGFTPLPPGMVHAPSLLAPLQRHDRLNETSHQLVVTVHDVVAWTHPESLSPKQVAWHKAMAKRAERYADAIVVPTHAVATALDEILGVGDRTRVIGGAVSPRLRVPADDDALADAMKLPDRYLVTVGGLESRRGITALLDALALPAAPDLPLLVVGPDEADGVSLTALVEAAGLAPDRVRALGYVSDAELAVVLDRAAVLVFPSLAEGFGLPVLEAFSLGTPVIHSDAPALVEVAGEAGLAVAIDDPDGYPERIAEAIGRVVYDPGFAAELAVLGRDRAGLFSWQASAEKVWALHADL
jgi:glycosyltransferase involved in cell wall biosynthesis